MDFLATKGIEYLLVIGYLLLLIPVWRLVLSPGAMSASREGASLSSALEAVRGWFRIPKEILYHQGHSWASPTGGDDLFRVGMDDFAQRLVGPPDSVETPGIGETVRQGEPAWSLRIDGETVDMLAPVGGPVERINEEVLQDPSLLCRDPYGRGWLLEIRCPRPRAEATNLLTGRLAEGWMEGVAARLSSLMGPSLGPVLQDGGIPVSGFAREVAPESWTLLAKELLLTSSTVEGSRVAPRSSREIDARDS